MFYTNKYSTINYLQSVLVLNLSRNPLCFPQMFRNFLVAVSTCVSLKWPIHIVSIFETRTPLYVSIFETRTPRFFGFFLAKIVIVSLIIYFENLGTAVFKKWFIKPSFELWSNLWKPPVKQLVFKKVAGLESQRYTYLDHQSKNLK